jgi:hypothetical protein
MGAPALQLVKSENAGSESTPLTALWPKKNGKAGFVGFLDARLSEVTLKQGTVGFALFETDAATRANKGPHFRVALFSVDPDKKPAVIERPAA